MQRSGPARAVVEGRTVGSIDHGLVVLLGVRRGDTAEAAEQLARKVARLRVFQDAEGKMNLDLMSVNGAVLVVSQFTLYAETRGGNRPGFGEAAPPDEANRLYSIFVERLRDQGVQVETGAFRATMDVHLVNRGPVTILLEA